MLLRSLLPVCACLLIGCSVFPDSPPQVGTPADSGTDTDAPADAPEELDVSVEADAAEEADAPGEADAPEEALEGGDADADAIESGDVQVDAPDHCFDDATNVNETDLNCGGPECPKCGKGKSCVKPGDCESDSCNPGNKCN